MTPRIDLDAARAARREAEQDPPVIVLDGEDFTLPIELPFEIAGDLGKLFAAKGDKDKLAELAGQVVPLIVKGLLGDDHDRFMEHRPSFDDLIVLLEGMAVAYGLADVGESSASA